MPWLPKPFSWNILPQGFVQGMPVRMRANWFDGGRDVRFRSLFRWLYMGVAARLARRPEAAFVQPAYDSYHHFRNEAGTVCQHFFHFLEHVLQFRGKFVGEDFVFHVHLFFATVPNGLRGKEVCWMWRKPFRADIRFFCFFRNDEGRLRLVVAFTLQM